MNNITLEEKDLLECVRDLLNQSKKNSIEIKNARYHHNSSYINAPSIIKNGILSMQAMNDIEVRLYSKEALKLMSDIESHINDSDGVSLSVVGLTDLYPDEEEYNPYNGNYVDFLVDSSIQASRSTTFYGNEFIARYMIPNDKIRSVDVRIFDDLNFDKDNHHYLSNNEALLLRYNSLRNMAITLRDLELNIPLRDNSKDDNHQLDILTLASSPRLILKK